MKNILIVSLSDLEQCYKSRMTELSGRPQKSR